MNRPVEEDFAAGFAESVRIDVDVAPAFAPHYYRGMQTGMALGSLAVRATAPTRWVAAAMLVIAMLSAGWVGAAHAGERHRDVELDTALMQLQLAVTEEGKRNHAAIVTRRIEEAIKTLRSIQDHGLARMEARHAIQRIHEASR
jgi:hypothetical protein